MVIRNHRVHPYILDRNQLAIGMISVLLGLSQHMSSHRARGLRSKSTNIIIPHFRDLYIDITITRARSRASHNACPISTCALIH